MSMTDKQLVESHTEEYMRLGHEFENERKPWTDRATDHVLNQYYGGAPLFGFNDSLMVRAGRKPLAIERRLWGVATAYGQRGGKPFPTMHQPTEVLKSRVGEPFTDRELYMLYWAFGEGCRRGANDPDYLAQILGRNVSEIQEQIDHCVKQINRFQMLPDPDHIAVRRYLKGNLADRVTLFNEIRDEANRIRKLRLTNDADSKS